VREESEPGSQAARAPGQAVALASQPVALVSLLLALSSASCSAPGLQAGDALPSYAAPKARRSGGAQELGSDVIRYRRLTREDFRGSEPPPEFAPQRDRIGAATCAYLAPRPEMSIALVAVASNGAVTSYQASPEGVGFRALMNRDCSWWNAEQTRIPPDYVLEHEQIHFALLEIHARRLDARAGELAQAATASSSDPDEAIRLAHAKLEAELSKALAKAMQRQREFDEDTSMGFRPDRQAVWLERVRAELVQTSEAAGEQR
jgi:hypothetical protein